METALSFNEVQFTPVTRDNRILIRSQELAQALGYKDVSSVSRIYQRNADEFSEDMSQVIEMTDSVKLTEAPIRVFSLRGCHLVAMFARTPVAKAFRKWVLDVLDALNKQQAISPADASITPDQQCTLQALVKAKVELLPEELRKGKFPMIWSRFNNHFRIAKYAQLPQGRMSEAVTYLAKMKLVEGSLPKSQYRLSLPEDMDEGRKDALCKIESLHQRIFSSFGALDFVVRSFCHPGAKTMKQSTNERMAYDIMHRLYLTACDNLAAAYHAIDAGYKLAKREALA